MKADDRDASGPRRETGPAPRRAVSTATISLAILSLMIIAILAGQRGLSAGAVSTVPPESGIATAPTPSTPTMSAGTTGPSETVLEAPSISPTYRLPGDVPGPDATLPANQPVIPGLRVDALAATWDALGLTCVSWPGYSIHCEATDSAANAHIVAEAEYLTMDGVVFGWIGIASIEGGEVQNSDAIAARLFAPTARLVGGEAAQEFVVGHIGDIACSDHCDLPLIGRTVSITVGIDGFQQMDLVATPTATP